MRTSSWGSRYAIVASTLALLLALGGTAFAVNTVRSPDIVDGEVRSRDIRFAAVQSSDIRNNIVSTIDMSPLSMGRSPRLWAKVDGSTGTLIRGKGVVTTLRNGTGSYDVDFNQDIDTCAVTVTSHGVQAMFFVQLMNDNASVFARDSANAAVDTSFDLLVVC